MIAKVGPSRSFVIVVVIAVIPFLGSLAIISLGRMIQQITPTLATPDVQGVLDFIVKNTLIAICLRAGYALSTNLERTSRELMQELVFALIMSFVGTLLFSVPPPSYNPLGASGVMMILVCSTTLYVYLKH